MKEQNTDLIGLPPSETALQVYSTPNGLEPYLAKIKAELDAFVPDVTTKKGRDAIASIAYKVAKGKTALDNIGKDLVAELKDVPKKIDAERKRMRDLLDLWKDEVRAPLTAWEEAEEARQALHKRGIEWFSALVNESQGLATKELRQTLQLAELKIVDESWEEFEAEAHRVKAKTLAELAVTLIVKKSIPAVSIAY